MADHGVDYDWLTAEWIMIGSLSVCCWSLSSRWAATTAYIQGQQLNMTVFFRYLVKSVFAKMSSVPNGRKVYPKLFAGIGRYPRIKNTRVARSKNRLLAS